MRYTDYRQLEADLAAGRIDIASSMARTPARAATLEFTAPYTRLRQALLTRADAPIAALAPVSIHLPPVAVACSCCVGAEIRLNFSL